MQTIVVSFIVLIAILFAGRRIYRILNKNKSMGCSCAGCSQCREQSSCNTAKNISSNDNGPKKGNGQ